MSISLAQPNSVNILMSNSAWAWPQAVQQIFQPRGVNTLLAESTDDIVRIIDNSKVHLAIIDQSIDNESGLKALEIIRKKDRLLPCVLLAGEVNNKLLATALSLHVCSVLAKPVDIIQLAEQMDRIFRKYYSSSVFAAAQNDLREYLKNHSVPLPNKSISSRFSIRIRRGK